jgi:vacuolar-type H+-ATPase subunit I/STV1
MSAPDKDTLIPYHDNPSDHRMTIVGQSGSALHYSRPKWSWCATVVSAFGLICCSPLGIVSMLAAGHSYTDHKVQDYERAKKKRRIAYGFGIAAIVVGSVLIVIYIIFIEKIVAKMADGIGQ